MEAMAAILDGTGMQASLDGKMILVVKNGQQTEARLNIPEKSLTRRVLCLEL